MKWKKVNEEFPPIGKKILISRCENLWHPVIIHRPFDKDKKYNPDYYIARYKDCNNEFELDYDYLWMQVEEPKHK